MENKAHPFKPIYDENSKILILGSFPSVKSRSNNFYYGHPSNRFWKVIAKIVNEDIPSTKEEKEQMLIRNKIAIWDIIKSCDIEGSADTTIKNVVINDIEILILNSQIKHIFFNGKKAYQLFNKYKKRSIKIDIEVLPSTSPANASYSLERLYNEWKEKLKY